MLLIIRNAETQKRQMRNSVFGFFVVPTLVLVLAALVPAPVPAAKIYKWIDENGKVSYRDKPPPEAGGKLEEKHIDPNRNVIKSRRPVAGTTANKKPGANKKASTDDKDDNNNKHKKAKILTGADELSGGQPAAPNSFSPTGTPPVSLPSSPTLPAPTPLPTLTLPSAPGAPPPATP